uniref:ComEC/Rec2 family competence protein n=3 Tax=Gelidibacter sp. TaxID=2018083 RepID=UPI00404B3AF8
MKLLNFAIIKLATCLIVGIVVGYLFPMDLIVSLSFVFGILFLLVVIYFIVKNQLKKTIWFGIVAAFTTIFIGILVVNLHNQKLYKNHYTNKADIEKVATVLFRIREVLKPNAYYDKYIVDVLKIDDTQVSGKLLLNVQKDSLQNTITVDDILISKTSIQNVNSSLNPHQFDYKAYLERRYIYHQISTSQPFLLVIDTTDHTFFGYADTFRRRINKQLKASNFKGDELAIINALLLGQRQDISPEIFNSYSQSGAIHILAVSGLHIGLILLILQRTFKPIEYIKHGRFIKTSIIVLLLWSFAIIAGLSPSVTRAVTMFSIVAIGMNLKRPTNIYNTLAISLFVLLLFKPLFLFEVGFQMSYLAVISIVTIQPILEKFWKPKNKILKFYWQVFTVTVAAQFGVVPISLLYFHQFPSLFFVTNLAIIPVLGVILGFGILVIFLALLKILPQWLASGYMEIIHLMNQLVAWVAHQEQFVFKDIPFSIWEVLASYVMIIAFVMILKKQTFSLVSFTLISVILFQLVLLFEKYQNQTDELVIFQKSRFSIIGEKQNHTLKISHNLDSNSVLKENTIKNYKIGNYIKNITTDSILSVYQMNNKTLLVIDSFGIYQVKHFKPDYILLRNSPKVNLERLIDSLQPELIIADGSNYKSYLARWKATCIKRKRPFHQTNEKGAFIIK